MNCVVPGRGIRAFGKAIQCLAKIGEELYIEALRKGLTLKTVNSARSAFGSFLFCRDFFNSYSDGLPLDEGAAEGDDDDDGGGGDGNGGDGGDGGGRGGGGGEREEGTEDTVKCKITIKSCLTVFRALSSLEKTVDHFTLSLNLKLSKLVFVFYCKHGIVRTHNLGFQECEALQAVFTKELCPNHIKVQSRTLGEVVLNFPSFVEEVTMTADPESVRLKNFSEDDGTRSTLTEVILLPAEFDDYQIGVDTSITFCLKELRAVLLFTDAFPQALSVQFESAGRPVVFSIDDNTDFKADFVLATLLDPNIPASTTSAPTNIAPSTSRGGIGRQRQAVSAREKVLQNGRRRRPERRVANEEGPTRCEGDDEAVDEWYNPFSRHDGREETERNNTTQSADRTTHIRNPVSHPLPSTGGHSSSRRDGDGEMVGMRGGDGGRVLAGSECGDVRECGGEEREGGRCDEVIGVDTADPLNALFGEENMMDVGEEGEGGWDVRGFRMDLQPVPNTTSRDDRSGRPTSTRSPPHLPTLAPHTTTSPHPPHLTPPNSPPSPVREDGWWGQERRTEEANTTQNSILQDSGFLPGTPPAKKPRNSSLLGLFTSDLSTPQQSLILAPDSEDESS